MRWTGLARRPPIYRKSESSFAQGGQEQQEDGEKEESQRQQAQRMHRKQAEGSFVRLKAGGTSEHAAMRLGSPVQAFQQQRALGIFQAPVHVPGQKERATGAGGASQKQDMAELHAR